MRISELSDAAGVPVATVKYYLRERLLPAGRRTAVNQATYDDDHLHRLRLIRALREVADLPVATIRAILDALDDPGLPVHAVLGVAHHALGPASPTEDDADLARARAEVDAFVGDMGWHVSPRAPARVVLAQALVSLRRLGRDVPAEVFDEYAQHAERLAAWELDRIDPSATRAEQLEQVVVGTVVYEQALIALRRLAQEHHSTVRTAATPPGPSGRTSSLRPTDDA